MSSALLGTPKAVPGHDCAARAKVVAGPNVNVLKPDWHSTGNTAPQSTERQSESEAEMAPQIGVVVLRFVGLLGAQDHTCAAMRCGVIRSAL